MAWVRFTADDNTNNRHLYTRQSYNSFGLPSRIARGPLNGGTEGTPTSTLDFVYGPEHQRVAQIITGGADAGTTAYVNGVDGLDLTYEATIKPDGLVEHRHYVGAAGQPFAIFTLRTGNVGSLPATERSYLHLDQLGSIVRLSDQNGALAEALGYDAWGKRRGILGQPDPTDALRGGRTDRGYTLHEHLDDVALVHMNARVYDPYGARFLSADPFIQDVSNLQGYNRYSYVYNNPLALTDPTGYFSLTLQPVTNYGAGFGLSDLFTNSSPTRQFVGSYRVDVWPVNNGSDVMFVLNDNSSFKSFGYGVAPAWERSTFGPAGNMRQTYWWMIEPRKP